MRLEESVNGQRVCVRACRRVKCRGLFVWFTLNGQGVAQANDAHLHGAVVGLPKVAIDASSRRDVDDATMPARHRRKQRESACVPPPCAPARRYGALLLLAHVVPSRSRYHECTPQVHTVDNVKVGRLHLLERA